MIFYCYFCGDKVQAEKLQFDTCKDQAIEKHFGRNRDYLQARSRYGKMSNILYFGYYILQSR